MTSDKMGFKQATGEPCVFVRRTEEGYIFCAVYVDDTLCVFSTLALKEWYMARFEEE